MKLKTRLLLATTITVLVILGASEWLNYFSMAAFVDGHETAMAKVGDHASLMASLERDKHELLGKLILLHAGHACMTVLALIAVLHVLWWRLFLRPLERLLRHIHTMGLGIWTNPIRIERSDEIGDLIKAFNALGDQLAASVQQVSLTSRLSAMALLGGRIVRKASLARDHIRGVELMLTAARREGVPIPEPVISNLAAIGGDLEKIADEFEADFAHEFRVHSVSIPFPQTIALDAPEDGRMPERRDLAPKLQSHL